MKHPVVVALLVALFAGALAALRPVRLEMLEAWTYDKRVALAAKAPAAEEIVIVELDDRTNRERPHLITHRAGSAALLSAVRAGEPSVIGVDLFFSDAEALLGAELGEAVAELVARPGDDTPERRLLERVHDALSGDAALEQVIAEGRDVVLALHVGDRRGNEISARALARGTFGQATVGERSVTDRPNVHASLEGFSRRAAALGVITIQNEQDGVVRQMPLVYARDQRFFAAFAVMVLARHLGVGRAELAYLGQENAILLGDRRIRLGEDGRLYLNWRSPESFARVSAADLLAGRVAPEALRGKMALIGVTYLGHDTERTSASDVVPGVLLHANLIDNLLADDFVTRAAPLVDALLSVGLGLVVALLFLPALRLSPVQLLVAVLVVGAVYFAATAWLLSQHALWVAWVSPALGLLAVLIAGLVASYLQEGRERRRVRSAFARYLAPTVLEELLSGPDRITLGGARREITVLFSDVRGFTTLSENLTPEQVMAFLNRYLTPMTEAVLHEGGFLDKYIGDAVMAVFGAPVSTGDHADRALAAALAMHAAVEALRPGLANEGIELAIGVGLNTGEAVVGNMGSETLFDYTAVGDSVNLASRTEGLTKTYGVFCLVTESTRAAARDDWRFREVDLVRVKGKDAPVPLHELLAGPGREVASYDDLAGFAEALAAWREGRFGDARRGMEAFAAKNPHDRVAPLYLARLSDVGESAPEGWDGVFTHRTK